ncbi:MAG TPA: exodeoxyribonuclease VII small subunit [Methylotenera sp.]|nr:exodeoxyribonuclease VII small subunit [Methylotenera sp.]HPH05070.1 exodeoxyribonuclease VII small subunit [Methylotenera sp.]HPN02136.1 exodeoxyribonuclease VII small subunit [Methylotenera sp.]
MPTKKTPEPAQPKSYELAFSELENIVAQMESGQMNLETSLAAYQRGIALLAFCQKSLADVEQQVQILNERNQLAAFKPEID